MIGRTVAEGTSDSGDSGVNTNEPMEVSSLKARLQNWIDMSDGGIRWRNDALDDPTDAYMLDEENWHVQNVEADDALDSFTRSRDVNILEEAIRLYRTTADPTLPGTLSDLAGALDARFHLSAHREDIEEIISLYRSAFNSTPPGHVNHGQYMKSLAMAFRTKYTHFGAFGDLEQSIDLYRQALCLTPEGHPGRAAMAGSLADTLICRYDELRQLDDLDNAISLRRIALETEIDRSMQVAAMCSLARHLCYRYELLKTTSNVDEAIRFFREAKSSFRATSSVPYVVILAALAGALLERAQGDQPISNTRQVEEALALLHEALALTPHPHYYRPIVLNHLGGAYQTMFSVSRSTPDIDSSVRYSREAIEALPDNTARHTYHVNLADSLRIKFEHSPDLPLLTEAIGLCRRILIAIPYGHPEHISYLSSLGRMLLALFHHTHATTTLDEALDVFRSGALLPTGFVGDRFAAARTWARSADDTGHNSAMDAYRHAISILHSLSLVGMEMQNRYLQLLAHDTTLAADAAACAIGAGHFQEAVEFLESGRSILWSQNAGLRSPLDELRLIAPDLAGQFEDVCQELERGTHVSSESPRTDDVVGIAVERQRKLSKTRDDLLIEIRKLPSPSFKTFLLPTPFAKLKLASARGPIILVNAVQSRCDALLVMPNQEVLHVPLRNVALSKIGKLRKSVFNNRDARHFKSNVIPRRGGDHVAELLALLWDAVVLPVLETLARAGYGPRTHVWWCSSGKFAGLPWHAAGAYPVGQSCIDLVISSYTPTISALLRAQENKLTSSAPHLLVIAQPETPDLPALPRVTDEVGYIRKIVPEDMRMILEGSDASMETVSSHLPRCSWVHFACHGSQNTARPFESCFSLHDGPLTLDALMQVHRQLDSGPKADFAFLTACHTASSSSDNPDEAVHLASGLQFAGFRSVIGALWEIDDRDGLRLAEEVYGYLFRGGDVRLLDSTEAAEALNRAVKALRDSGVPAYRWVPFVHIGV